VSHSVNWQQSALEGALRSLAVRLRVARLEAANRPAFKTRRWPSSRAGSSWCSLACRWRAWDCAYWIRARDQASLFHDPMAANDERPLLQRPDGIRVAVFDRR
jgi:hypothetical protein